MKNCSKLSESHGKLFMMTFKFTFTPKYPNFSFTQYNMKNCSKIAEVKVMENAQK